MTNNITICDNRSKQRFVVFLGVLLGLTLPLMAQAPFSNAGATGGIPDAQAGDFTMLVDPDATEEAQGLMRYLSAIYGQYSLAGEQMSYNGPWKTSDNRWAYEIGKIRGWTGKEPAIRGYDYMDVINSWGSPVMDYARKWATDTGGIVTLCWHWRGTNGSFNNDGYTLPQEPANDTKLKDDIHKLAVELKKFQSAGIPVIFRPLHEAPGAWFWWGNSGSTAFKKLWTLMYDILVNQEDIHNLIWVMSYDDGHSGNTSWYPGNDKVDIVGVDGYSAKWQELWDPLWGVTNKMSKMIAMTENKKIPAWNSSRPWLYSTTWNNEIFDQLGENDFKSYYAEPQTISLKDLPTYMGKAKWTAMLPHVPSSSSQASSSSTISSSSALSSSILASSSSQASASYVTLDNFDDDATSQTTLGAHLGLAAHAGFWYGFTDADHGGTSTITPNVVDEDTRFAASTSTQCDNGTSCLHSKITLGDGYAYPYAAIGFNILDEGESIDLSTMTKMTLRAKGQGTLRVKFMTEKVTDGYPKGSNWGDMGVDLVLTAEWKTYTILPSDIKPQPYSPQATDKLTWADCMTSVRKIHLQTGPNMKAGQVLDLWMDDMIWEGVSPALFGGDWEEIPVPVLIRKWKSHMPIGTITSFDLLGRRK